VSDQRSGRIIVKNADTVHLALLTGANIGGGSWLTAWIVLIAASALVTRAWFSYRWWRFRRQAADEILARVRPAVVDASRTALCARAPRRRSARREPGVRPDGE
jgi:hypothetical protein